MFETSTGLSWVGVAGLVLRPQPLFHHQFIPKSWGSTKINFFYKNRFEKYQSLTDLKINPGAFLSSPIRFPWSTFEIGYYSKSSQLCQIAKT